MISKDRRETVVTNDMLENDPLQIKQNVVFPLLLPGFFRKMCR